MMTSATAAAALRRDNLIGSLWMVLAMLGFAIEDSLFKAASTQLPVAQVLFLVGLAGIAGFAAVAQLLRDRVFSRDTRARPMQIRMGFEVFGRLFYVLALAVAPLSAATVILQATPVVVVAAAALVFGERVGPRRIAAIAIGFLGVLVVLQPGADSFQWSAVLAVCGMLGFAGRDLASRAAPKSLSPAVLGVYGYVAIMVAGLLFGIWSGAPWLWPDAAALGILAMTVAVGALAYVSLMKAMRTGEVSAVTPFRYSRLLIGIGIGVLWFDEALRPSMLMGSALILCAGFLLLWSGRVQNR